MSFYRKEEARNVRAFCLVHFTLFLFSFRRLSSFRPSVLFLLYSLELHSSFLLFILRPSFFYRVLYLRDKDLPPAPYANRVELFADNFAERKSHRVRLLSESIVVRLYRFLRRLLAVSSSVVKNSVDSLL